MQKLHKNLCLAIHNGKIACVARTFLSAHSERKTRTQEGQGSGEDVRGKRAKERLEIETARAEVEAICADFEPAAEIPSVVEGTLIWN